MNANAKPGPSKLPTELNMEQLVCGFKLFRKMKIEDCIEYSTVNKVLAQFVSAISSVLRSTYSFRFLK